MRSADLKQTLQLTPLMVLSASKRSPTAVSNSVSNPSQAQPSLPQWVITLRGFHVGWSSLIQWTLFIMLIT